MTPHPTTYLSVENVHLLICQTQAILLGQALEDLLPKVLVYEPCAGQLDGRPELVQ